jgi:hypothetical protein
MSFKYSNGNLKKIEEIFKHAGYIIRYERGSFNSGYCILEEKKVAVINKFYDTEARINCLIEIISELEIDVTHLDVNLKRVYSEISQQKLAI